MLSIQLEPHPHLDLGAIVAALPVPQGQLVSPDWLTALLYPDAEAPLRPDADVRAAVRDLLRHGGYKPTGRGKPASEYLEKAAGEGSLRTIAPVVDVGNAVSLHSGLPISVVDLERARGPLAVRIAAPGTGYVFNAAGQEIQTAGLLCLHDGEGPCANAVKDAQRTKTGPDTRRALVLVWGAGRLGDRTERAVTWCRELLGRLGAVDEPVAVEEAV